MSRLLIVTSLITLLASAAFAADAPTAEKTKASEATEATGAGEGQKTMDAKKDHKAVKAKKAPKTIAEVNKEYYDKAAAEKGVVKTSSGLLYKSLKEGTGATPGILSTVTVNYRATLTNGKEFNSSYKRKSPEKHRMNNVFRCWQEGLLKMKVGGKAQLVCPPELAFAGRGVPNLVPKNAIVIYEIELLGVKK
ncbi:FKBP-type peptidyl-prolyl cis-trans isomerase [Geobacter sp. AOG2]|uniref:FKBP-type peptidyl-prolyl cis-trans isomerase n=1 Tax=Geobacter sp. AOG2 TaxID=1566347 RepID=UPI001CC68D3F|nr:FKBP-type peptidyl-prolyl cis-trans isomerase [Geobacter sp. AOG2]GFE62115.1 hypothetical protein AOG2_27030 [Geobacter sp. AOG2]